MKHSILNITIILLFASAAPLSCASRGTTSPSEKNPVAASLGAVKHPLGWIGGYTWRAGGADNYTEEHWAKPVGGAWIGYGRAIMGGKTVFFEYLRIEPRDGGLVYVAQPMGGPKTEFKATLIEANKVVFENPDHDMPKKITYERTGERAMRARIEGVEGGKPASETWDFYLDSGR